MESIYNDTFSKFEIICEKGFKTLTFHQILSDGSKLSVFGEKNHNCLYFNLGKY